MTDARPDRISLTLPSTTAYRGVVSLVVGGVGGRIDLPYERTDDLQLAILSALEAVGDGPVTVEMGITDDALTVSVGPLADGAGSDRALLSVLDKLVDATEGSSRDGREWLTLSLSRPSD